MTRSARLPRRSALARRGLAGGATALVLLVASGCGGSDDDDAGAAEPSSSIVSSEPGETEDSSPAQDAGDTGTTGETAAEGEKLDADEFVELLQDSITQETTARVEIETAGAGIGGGLNGEGDIDLGTTPPSISLTSSIGGQTADVRVVDGLAYIQVPGAGGKFLRLDLADPANPLGQTLVDQFDLEGQFAAFGDAIEEVVLVGTEEVDGEQLDHYVLTVDGEVLADQIGGTPLEQGAELLPDELTYDIYLAEDGLFRELTFELPELGVTSTLRYSDWGKDVSITAPRPGQVTSMPSLPGLPGLPG